MGVGGRGDAQQTLEANSKTQYYIIVQSEGETFYAGDGRFNDWEMKLLTATGKHADKKFYGVTELIVDRNILGINNRNYWHTGKGLYDGDSREFKGFSLDDKTRGLLLKILGGEK